MARLLTSVLAAFVAVVALTACTASKSSNPLSPSVAGPISGVDITAPRPVNPAAGEKVAVDQQPLNLMVENAASSGQRPLSYVFEVANDADFTNTVFTRVGVTPGEGRTSLRLPDPLATGRSYYWRARAEDGANTGPYSPVVTFSVVTPVVMILLFYLTVTPTAILMRLFGKDPLRLRFDRAAKSYWIERVPPGPAPETMRNQF